MSTRCLHPLVYHPSTNFLPPPQRASCVQNLDRRPLTLPFPMLPSPASHVYGIYGYELGRPAVCLACVRRVQLSQRYCIITLVDTLLSSSTARNIQLLFFFLSGSRLSTSCMPEDEASFSCRMCTIKRFLHGEWPTRSCPSSSSISSSDAFEQHGRPALPPPYLSPVHTMIRYPSLSRPHCRDPCCCCNYGRVMCERGDGHTAPMRRS